MRSKGKTCRACCHRVNMMSSRLLPPWPPTKLPRVGTIASMATTPRIGRRQRAHLYIDEWFEERGVNDAKVAAKLDLDRTTVWKWRTNPSRLDPGKMQALADALDIEPEELY